MNHYEYSVSTNIIWTSFDYGEVEANSFDPNQVKINEKL